MEVVLNAIFTERSRFYWYMVKIGRWSNWQVLLYMEFCLNSTKLSVNVN